MDERVLTSLRTKIGAEWFLLGSHLGYSSAQLEHLQNTFPYNIPRCIGTMLSKWNEVMVKTNQNSKELLIEALKDVGRVDLAEEISNDQISVGGFDEVDGVCRKQSQGGTTISKLIKQITFKRNSRRIDEYIDQSIQYLKHKEKEKDLFVPTRAYRQTEELYRLSHVVTILGHPGDGKTTIALQLLLQLHQNGETVVVLSNPCQIDQINVSNTHTIFFIDDAFGTPTFDKSLVDSWVRLYEKLECLVESNKCALVLTSRKQVFTQCVNLLCKCERIKQNIVDLTTGSDQFNRHERALIAAKYIQKLHVLSDNTSVKVPILSYIPGFPLMCKMFASVCCNGKDAAEYFKNPIIFFKQQIENLHASDPISYCGLVLMTVFDGRLPRDVLDDFESSDAETQSKMEAVMKCCGLSPSCDKSNVEKNLDSMVGQYVDEADDEFFFLHDAIFDAVCFVFGKRRPREILKVASADFVERRIRTQNTDEATTSESNLIILPKGRYKDLAERWIRDMKNGNLSSVYDNPSFDDDYMRALFLDRVRSFSNEEIWQTMNSRDKKRGKPCILLTCSVGMESMIVLSINQLVESNFHPCCKPEDEENVHDAFFELVRNRFLKATEALLKLNFIDINRCLHPNRQQAVHLAVQNSDVDMLDLLLRHKAKISQRDCKGALPIHYASRLKTPSCLYKLLMYGAKVNVLDITGCLPVHYATKSGNLECVQRLLEENIDIHVADITGKELIHFAAMNENDEIMKFMIDKGANLNKLDNDHRTPLHYACKEGLVRNVRMLLYNGAKTNLPDSYGDLPIHLICDATEGHNTMMYECLRTLLDFGPSEMVNALNDDKKSPLNFAACWPDNRSEAIILKLIEKGADINLSDRFQNSPVINACRQGSFMNMRLLLKHGANPNAVECNGRGLLHHAAMKTYLDGWKVLSDWRIDVNQTDNDGKRPLHIACQYGNDVFVKHLLENEADINARDNQGLSPLHNACRWYKLSTVKILVQHNVDPLVEDSMGDKPINLLPSWNIYSQSCSQIKEILNTYMERYQP